MNENWPRWITASIAKHFDGYRDGVKLFVEGQHRQTRDEISLYELRVNGPYITEVSKGYFKLDVLVNVLVQATMDEDAYKIQKLTGTIVIGFIDIPLYRYGNGAADDGAFFGCLRIKQNVDKRHRIRIDYFGQIQSKTELQQATVDADYFVNLEN